MADDKIRRFVRVNRRRRVSQRNVCMPANDLKSRSWKALIRGLIGFVLVALVLTGCAFQNHIRQGDRHFENEKYRAALESYEEAHQLKPDSEKAAERVERAKKALLNHWRFQAEEALRKGDWVAAVEAAAEALEVAPGNDATRVLVQDIGYKAREEAAARADADEYAESLALYDAIIERLTTERLKAEPEARLVRQEWATILRGQAQQAEADQLDGLALLNWAKAADLQPDSGYESKMDSLYARVLADARYRVCLEKKRRGVGHRTVTEALNQLRLSDGLELVERREGKDCDVELELTVGQPSFDEIQSTHTAVKEYQSGTREVPNPAYERRERELNREKRELLEAEEEVDYQREQVDKYRSQVAGEGPTPNTSTGAEQNLSRAESRLEAARRRLESQRGRVQQAYDDLDRTDRYSEEPVYDELTYTVTTYRIDGQLRLRGTLEGEETVAIDQKLGVSASDEQHAAHPKAGVDEDPLTLPPENELVSQLYNRAASYVGEVLTADFEDYRQRLLQRESSDDARRDVDALVRYLVLDPREFDEQAVVKIDDVTGIPDADDLIRRAAESHRN